MGVSLKTARVRIFFWRTPAKVWSNLKKWKRCRKDQAKKSKDLISTAYCRCKIWKRVEPECLTNFLNVCFATKLTNSEFRRNSRLRKALWYMASTNQTILWGRTIILTTRRAKKIWGKLNGEFWQYFQNSSLSDPLTFDVNSEINTRLLLIWLLFVGIHVSILLFALLTYFYVEEVRTLNLEASTRY